VRWLIAFGLALFVAAPAQAGVFKGRGTDKTKPGAKDTSKPAPAPAKETTTTAKKPAPAPAATAKKPAPTKGTAVAKKPTPAKKPTSRVATEGRPKDLTPDSKKKDDVVVVEDEEDVIVRDLDDD
jgi:hypothetical protein